VQEKNGGFPANYEALLALKGIGSYTAAAIASFAFNLPYAVVDGNVFRVLARYFGETTPTDTTKGKQLFAQLAATVLDEDEPGLFNQAIMDFGATVCKPTLPQCNKCVLNKYCIAFENAIVNKLPVKEKRLTKKIRWISYFLFYHNNHVLVNKRTGNDIWQNLFEFYAVENEEAIIWTAPLVQEWLNEQFAIKKASIQLITALASQQLTHQKIKGQFIKIELNKVPVMLKKYQWQPALQLSQLAFPKFINHFFEKKEIQRNLF
jgi:A/G-specific adenine glycosylase